MITFIVLTPLVLVGHLGWWVFSYNHINSSAIPRRLIKLMELAIVALTAGIPLAFILAYWPALQNLFRGESTGNLPTLLIVWGAWSLGCVAVLGPGWLESRLWLWPPRNLLASRVERLDVADHVAGPVTGKWLSSSLRKLPINEITHLSITQKTIQLEREFPRRWESLTIGHLSDLHFTGELTPAFYHYVIERMQALSPDLIAITGDIIDKDGCIDWIEPILGRLSAPLGCYFLFGNHERRLSCVEPVAERLRGLGWCDVGVQDVAVEPGDIAPHMSGRPRMILCGNERPWFERHVGNHWHAGPLADAQADTALKIALAHTPDQHPWARELGMDLMLAGHTHGGQVRIPCIGPLIAPSRYGSRFASGVFRLPPTIMHVSRGLSGTQPLRWRCPPEISLLTILPNRAADEAYFAEARSVPSAAVSHLDEGRSST